MKKWQKVTLVFFPVLLIAVIVICFYIFPGLGKERSSKEEKIINLRLWYPWENDGEAYKKSFLEAVDEFNKANNKIHILAEGTEMELYREKLPSAIASNDIPDIYFCFGDSYLQGAVNSGKLLKMNGYLSEDIYDRFHREAMKELTYNGGVYGLGFSENIAVLFINREMFEAHKIPIPSDWNELLEVCQKFIARDITPFACSGDTDTGYRLYLENICLSEAGSAICSRVLKQEGSPEDIAAFTAGVEKFCHLRDIGAFGDSLFSKSTQDVENDFYLSRIPMYLAKSDFAGNVMQENNPLYGKLLAVPFPGTQGGKDILGGISEVFVIDKTTEYPGEAVQALEVILENFAAKLYKRGAGIPVWDTGNVPKPQDDIYWQIRSMTDAADNKMQYWEFYLDRRRAEEFMKSAELLAAKDLTQEQFVKTLCEKN